MNTVDGLLLMGILLYAGVNAHRGVIRVSADLAVLAAAFLLAVWLYPAGARVVGGLVEMSRGFANALGFFGVFVAAHVALGAAAWALVRALPERWHASLPSRILALFPGALYGALLAGILLLLVVTAPAPAAVKTQILEARLGGALVERASAIEDALRPALGDAVRETLTFLTVAPEADVALEIPPLEGTLPVDAATEARLLELVNRERAAHGAGPLVADSALREVARAHSRDMWARGYFSHVSPDGEDPFRRIRAAGIPYRMAGENLAMAQSADQAHRGLMNSPGHRRNILEPGFGRVGIGVIDGGRRGKMITQKFAN